MNCRPAAVALVVVVPFLAACATTPVNMNEPRRVVGTESNVRVDAEIRGDELRPGTPVPITYQITNLRETPIAIADVIPLTEYDSETHTVTVDIGSEVPGEQTLPRLVSIAPGEKKTFTTAARVALAMQTTAAPGARRPISDLRLRVTFLNDTAPFAKLLDIPERVVADKALADALFPVWLERNEVVYTNSVPMRWIGRDMTGQAEAPTPTRRGRRPLTP